MVQFYSAASPQLCTIKQMYGFVEELVDFKKSDKETENMTLI
jgi:hypothetical protein